MREFLRRFQCFDPFPSPSHPSLKTRVTSSSVPRTRSSWSLPNTLDPVSTWGRNRVSAFVGRVVGGLHKLHNLRIDRDFLAAGVWGQDLTVTPSRRQNGKNIGRKRAHRIVVLTERPLRFEIEAILASTGFDPFCPLLRWQSWT